MIFWSIAASGSPGTVLAVLPVLTLHAGLHVHLFQPPGGTAPFVSRGPQLAILAVESCWERCTRTGGLAGQVRSGMHHWNPVLFGALLLQGGMLPEAYQVHPPVSLWVLQPCILLWPSHQGCATAEVPLCCSP